MLQIFNMKPFFGIKIASRNVEKGGNDEDLCGAEGRNLRSVAHSTLHRIKDVAVLT